MKTVIILVFAIALAYHAEKKVGSSHLERKPANKSAEPQIFFNKTNPSHMVEIPTKLLKEIEDLAACYEKNCDRPSIDPRTDYYNLGQDLKKKLIQYEHYVIKHKLQNSSIPKLAQRFLSHSDGHVQEVALDILSTQETSPDSLHAILQNIINGIDAMLIHQALLELQRYTDSADQEQIRLTLGHALLHGTPFVASALADRMNLILNSQNIEYFESLMAELDPKSKIYLSLKFSIQEFDLQSQAG